MNPRGIDDRKEASWDREQRGASDPNQRGQTDTDGRRRAFASGGGEDNGTSTDGSCYDHYWNRSPELGREGGSALRPCGPGGGVEASKAKGDGATSEDLLQDGLSENPVAPIRGRHVAPGRDEGDAASGRNEGLRIIHDAAASGAEASTKHAGTVGLVAAARKGRTGDVRASSSTNSANAYIMEAYLGHHRERVQKRKEAEVMEGRSPAATAAQRLAAIRCRVANRQTGNRQSMDAANSSCLRRGDTADAGAGSTKSTEDSKMHFESAAPAEDIRGGGADQLADTATSAAASGVAWHTVATTPRRD